MFVYPVLIDITRAVMIQSGQAQLFHVPSSHFPIIDIEPPKNATNISLLLNQPKPYSNASTGNENYHFDCDGPTYGERLDIDDCLSALGRITRSRASVTFMERFPGMPDNTYPLPWRWMGGTSLPDRFSCTPSVTSFCTRKGILLCPTNLDAGSSQRDYTGG